jgi:hypothetical protein
MYAKQERSVFIEFKGNQTGSDGLFDPFLTRCVNEPTPPENKKGPPLTQNALQQASPGVSYV